jgi:1,4-dihydroxy-2-naphthoate octaprenyltransferase
MKKIIISSLDFFSYSNIFVAICALAFSTQANLIICNGTLSSKNYLYSLLFSVAVFFIYGLQRVVDLLKNNRTPVPQNCISSRDKWVFKNIKMMTVLIVFSVIVITTLVFSIDVKLSLYLLPLLIISIMYSAGAFPLKKIPAIKSFVISFVWIVGIYIVPCFLNNKQINFNFWTYIVGQFFLVNAICIPFDIRDLEVDKLKKVQSIPNIFGVTASKIYAIAMLLVYFLLSVFFSQINYFSFSNLALATLLTFCYALCTILFTNQNRSDYFFSFLVDGAMLLQPFLLVFFRNAGYP